MVANTEYKEIALRVHQGDEDIEKLAEFLKGEYEVSYIMNSDTIRIRKKEKEPSYQKYRDYQKVLFSECKYDAFKTLGYKDYEELNEAEKDRIHSLAIELFNKRCQHLHYYMGGN